MYIETHSIPYLEDRAFKSKPIIEAKPLRISTELSFLRKLSILGLIHGFHSKMIDDAIFNIRQSGKTHKEQKKLLQKLANADRLFIECEKVKKYSMTIMKELTPYVTDADIKTIWLIIDRFLSDKILSHTFLTAVNTFIGIIDVIGVFGSCYSQLIAALTQVSEELSKELKEEKQKTYIKQGIDDPDFVFQCFELGDMKYSTKASELFFDIFTTREKFNSYAETHYRRMSKVKHDSFQRVLEQNNIN